MCTDPAWKKLNTACPVFEWQEYSMPFMTKGCTAQHRILLDPEEYPSFSEECDGKYQCSDRSDEAACAEVAAPYVLYEFEYSDFDCKLVRYKYSTTRVSICADCRAQKYA